jgi:exodeoxyribonuclease V gamma subunit
MLNVIYSERSEALLDALIDRITEERARTSELDPVQIIIPSRTVETYLKLGIARVTGIAANLKAESWSRFLRSLVESAAPDLHSVDRSTFEGLLLSIFVDDERMHDPDLEPLRRYLHAAGDREDAVEVRRHQLARELAMIFDGYVHARPEMIEAWRERTTITDPLYAEIERWQRKLFLDMFAPGALLDQRTKERGERWAFLPKLFDVVPIEEAPLPPSIHVFGFCQLPQGHYRLMERIARKSSVHVYALNPTRHFWEDSSAELSPALAAWGRGGREHIRALNALAGHQAEERFSELDEPPKTLLSQIQRDVLEGVIDPRERRDLDESVRILACPGVRREVEVVAQEIWRLVRETKGLRFCDIAVLLNDGPEQPYWPHLEAVFHECDGIPYNIIDRPLSAETRIIEAIELLLALPLGAFRRQEVLAVATHPAVISRHPEVDPREWLAWCDALSIVHGADHTDHEGTYIDKDLFNWDQGLRRLGLGVFLSGDGSGEPPIYDAGKERYVPEEVRGDRAISAARLSLLVRSLVADARFARSARLPLEEWITFLELFITSYVSSGSDQDERALRRCIKAIADLSELHLGSRPLSYRLVSELAKAAIAPLTGGRGQHLADGVVVASLAPMRAVPFRVIFVLGLGSGRFPASDRKNQLDLRYASWRMTDVSPEDRDRYMFLETILSARERLYLSYESRNAVTGETIEPSTVIHELLELSARSYLGPEGAKMLVRREHLRRFDLEYFPELGEKPPEGEPPYRSEGARLEVQARLLGESLRKHLGRSLDLRDMPRIRKTYGGAIAERLGLVSLPRGGKERKEREGPIQVTLTSIRRFLECPLQGSAKFALGLRDEEELDRMSLEDEAFRTAKRERVVALRRAFLRAARSFDGSNHEQMILEAYRDRAERLERRGVKPTGLFGEIESRWDVEVLNAWGRQLLDHRKGRGLRPLAPIYLGRADEDIDAGEVIDPLRLEIEVGGERREVEVVGATEPLLVEPSTSVILLLYDGGDNEDQLWARRERESLRGYVDQLVLSSIGRSTSDHGAFIAMAGDRTEAGAARREIAAIGKDEARAQLGTIIAEMIAGVHPYLFPFEAVLQLKAGESSVERIVDRIRGDLDQGKGGYATRFGPVPRPERYDTPSEEQGRHILETRFAPFFSLRRLR